MSKLTRGESDQFSKGRGYNFATPLKNLFIKENNFDMRA